jgi:membrane protease subunit (stomatin/prohibitin family)
MGWFTRETKSLFIARPSSFAKELVYLHPDKSIPRGSSITVRSDECALFFREGRYVGRLDSGTHKLDTANIPFLGHLVIDKFTDENHFITELFFVALSDVVLTCKLDRIGQYADLKSKHVVILQGAVSYAVKPIDPQRLILEIGGQSGAATSNIVSMLEGRLANGLRRSIGVLSAREPILSIVSNAEAERVSEELIGFARSEFEGMGLSLVRIVSLELKLDEHSLGLLRDFGRQEAALALQEKGAEIASRDGYAQYNLVQGQRAALEGMGQGMATGKPLMMFGSGVGGDLTRAPVSRPSPANSAPRPYQGPILAQPPQYYIVSDGGTKETGPYSAGFVAVQAISKNWDLNNVTVRFEDSQGLMMASEVSPIVSEYRRRKPQPS